MAEPTGTQVETTKDFGKDTASVARRWHAELKASEKYFSDHIKRADKAVKRFRDDEDDTGRRDDSDRFNVFWSTIKTLQPLVYARPPKVETERKFKDPDPVARAAAQLIERTLGNIVDVDPFEEAMEAARDDYLLAGRGQTWWRYIPTFGEPEKGDDGKEFNPVVAERAEPEFVHYRDFRHTPVPLWGKVTWVARRVLMTRDALVDRFGDIGKEVNLNQRTPGLTDDEASQYGDVFQRAAVWEIWDKTKREVVWVAEGFLDKTLDTKADPLGLEGFFPCPKPLYANSTPNTTVPVPDHHQWRHQLGQLDSISERISLLTEAIAVRGVYNSLIGESIQDLLSSRAENRLIPVDNWAQLQETGGLKGNVDFLPLEQLVSALGVLRAERDRLKQDFYEVSGVADIMRGASDPKETFGAQRIKARFGSVRVEDRQAKMQSFVRANLRIAAEIAGEHFTPETIESMSNWLQSKQGDEKTFAAALELLKSDKLRGFRIDVETDSTVAPDRAAEQQARVAFLTAVTPFLERAVPAAKENPALGRLLSEMLMFSVRGFSTGRQLETVFEQALSDMEKASDDGPSPEQQATAAKAQADIKSIEARIENDRAKLEIEAARLDMERRQMDGSADGDMARQLEDRQVDIDQRKAELNQRQQEIDNKRVDMEAARSIEMLKLVVDGAFNTEQLDEAQGRTSQGVETVRQIVAQLGAGPAQHNEAMLQALAQLAQAMQAMAAASTAPRRLVRDASGQIVASEIVVQ